MRKKNTFTIVGVYTTVILGAGFASGQELLKFFVDYGTLGLLGLLAAGAVFSVAGWAVLDICFQKGFKNYNAFIQFVAGDRLSVAIEVAAAFFMCVLFATMLAAGGATFKQVFHFPFTAGVVLVAGLCFAALLFDLEGLVAVNARIAPLLVVGSVLVGVFSLLQQGWPAFAGQREGLWIISAVVYASYNMITAVSVLSALGGLVDSRRTAMRAGILGGVTMTLLGLCLAFPLYTRYTEIAALEIPLLRVSQDFGIWFSYFYLLILLCAILTTALSNGFAIVQWITARFGLRPLSAKLILIVGGALLAHIGFSLFVAKVYPLFSFVGLFEIVMILLAWRKCKKLDRTDNS